MAITLQAKFETRREAEMTIERLVQEKGVERSDIFIAADGPSNTVGQARDGSDQASASPSPEDRDDGALNGPVLVSVDLQDDGRAEDVRTAFAEFGGAEVAQ